jgi:hypothetical protein
LALRRVSNAEEAGFPPGACGNDGWGACGNDGWGARQCFDPEALKGRPMSARAASRLTVWTRLIRAPKRRLEKTRVHGPARHEAFPDVERIPRCPGLLAGHGPQAAFIGLVSHAVAAAGAVWVWGEDRSVRRAGTALLLLVGRTLIVESLRFHPRHLLLITISKALPLCPLW